MQFSTVFTGKNYIELDSVDSTNNYAANLLNTTKVPDGTVIMAHYQEQGRGQMGNEWQSEPSQNLLCSIIYHPSWVPANKVFLISKISALSVRDTVTFFCKKQSNVKWPNDVYLDKRKISGMLIENQWKGSQLSCVIGIGININQTNFGSGLPATSFALETGHQADPKKVLHYLAQRLEFYYLKLKEGQASMIDSEYLESLLYFGQSRGFKANDHVFQGSISNVLDNGQLEITTIQNEKKYFNFKEVSFYPSI